MVGSGDAVASFDIVALLAAHRRSKAKVTMALFEVENPSEFGIVGLAKTADGDVDGGVGDGDCDAVTDLRRRSLVCVYERTYGHNRRVGEVDLSMVLHDLLSQYHGALDHG